MATKFQYCPATRSTRIFCKHEMSPDRANPATKSVTLFVVSNALIFMYIHYSQRIVLANAPPFTYLLVTTTQASSLKTNRQRDPRRGANDAMQGFIPITNHVSDHYLLSPLHNDRFTNHLGRCPTTVRPVFAVVVFQPSKQQNRTWTTSSTLLGTPPNSTRTKRIPL